MIEESDRLFKELLSTFFVEFLELFFPEVIAYLEPDSIKLMDKEIFTDLTAGEQYKADLVVSSPVGSNKEDRKESWQ